MIKYILLPVLLLVANLSFADYTPPTELILSSDQVSEGTPIGTLVAELSTDADPAFSDQLIFEIIPIMGMDDHTYFAIDGNELKTAREIFLADLNEDQQDFESFFIQIRVTDHLGNVLGPEGAGIMIIKVNFAPEDIILSTDLIPETSLVNGLHGFITVVDKNSEDDHTVTLVPGFEDNNLFSIFTNVAGENRISNLVTFDYATRNEYKIKLRACDQDAACYEKEFDIFITTETPQPQTDLIA
ncbi:MAG: cadherin repeat domain-containing protein, partial [Cyclobacteriaceae bacterium]